MIGRATILLLVLGSGPAGAACPAGLTVALDIGHTLAAPGATSARGQPEFLFNQALAHVVLATLTGAGYSQSFLVGDSGAPLRLEERTRLARAGGAGLFLSIHHDSVQTAYLSDWEVGGRKQRFSDRFHGFSVFFSTLTAQTAPSQAFATAIGHALTAAGMTPSLHHAEPIPGEGRTLVDPRIGLYRFDELAVLRTASMPAALLESGIIVNRDEELRLGQDATRHLIAAAIHRAVDQVCPIIIRPGRDSRWRDIRCGGSAAARPRCRSIPPGGRPHSPWR